MDDKKLLDIYTDYLISSFGLTTGSGLSRVLDGAISHDRIQRLLGSPRRSGRDLWKVVKPWRLARSIHLICKGSLILCGL